MTTTSTPSISRQSRSAVTAGASMEYARAQSALRSQRVRAPASGCRCAASRRRTQQPRLKHVTRNIQWESASPTPTDVPRRIPSSASFVTTSHRLTALMAASARFSRTRAAARLQPKGAVAPPKRRVTAATHARPRAAGPRSVPPTDSRRGGRADGIPLGATPTPVSWVVMRSPPSTKEMVIRSPGSTPSALRCAAGITIRSPGPKRIRVVMRVLEQG